MIAELKTRMMLAVACLLIISAGVYPFQDGKKSLRLIHAEELKRQNIAGKMEQKLIGKVEFVRGETIIKCDLARQIIGEDPISLIGHVRILDESRTLLADTVYFYQEEARQVALGNVVHITEKDTTKARRVTYFQNENRVVSEGNVRIANCEERSIVTGERASYWRDRGYGKLLDHPKLVRIDSLGNEIMAVAGDTMELFSGGDTTVVRGEVVVEQSKSTATCEKAIYFKQKDRAILTENPKVTQPNREIKGDSLTLVLKDSKLIRALVQGDAAATSDADTLQKGKWVNKLSGQSIEFLFEDEKLQEVVIEKQAISVHHVIENNQYKGKNEVSGDKILVRFQDGSPQQVQVISEPEFSAGKYYPSAEEG